MNGVHGARRASRALLAGRARWQSVGDIFHYNSSSCAGVVAVAPKMVGVKDGSLTGDD
jgi:hypothetical protein